MEVNIICSVPGRQGAKLSRAARLAKLLAPLARAPAARILPDDFGVVIAGRVAEVHADGGSAQQNINVNAGGSGARDPDAALVEPVDAGTRVIVDLIIGIIDEAAFDANGGHNGRAGIGGLLNDTTGDGAVEHNGERTKIEARAELVALGHGDCNIAEINSEGHGGETRPTLGLKHQKGGRILQIANDGGRGQIVSTPAASRTPVARVLTNDFGMVIGGGVAKIHANGGGAEQDVHGHTGGSGSGEPGVATGIPVNAGGGVVINFVSGIIEHADLDVGGGLYAHVGLGDIFAAADGFNDAAGEDGDECQPQEIAELAVAKEIKSDHGGQSRRKGRDRRWGVTLLKREPRGRKKGQI